MEDNNRQQLFDNYISEFVKLDHDAKNKEIIEKQKVIMALLAKYAMNKNISFNFLKSKEINDLINEQVTNDDYLEAIMVYMQNIEELIGTILKNIE